MYIYVFSEPSSTTINFIRPFMAVSRSIASPFIITAVVLACVIAWFFIDLPAVTLFHALDQPPYHDLFKTITRLGQSEWYLVGGLVIFLLLRRKKPQYSAAGLFLFTTTAVSGLSADLVKFIAGRARPKLFFSEGINGFDFFHIEHAWTSFPSGHSATAFSVAMAFALLWPKGRPFFLFAGALIAFSRIFLTQHYPSDVIAGSYIGIVSSILLYNHYFKKQLHD